MNNNNYLDINKTEINNLRPDSNIIINNMNVNNFDNNSEQKLKGGVEDIDDDITLNDKNKFISHCSKYKLFYILGGVLLAGTEIGLYFLIKYLTRKTEEVPIIIPTDILDYSTDIQYSTYISTTIPEYVNITNIPIITPTTIPKIIPTTIITTISTTIPTTIPIIPTSIINLECNDVSEFCNYSSTLNSLRNKLSNEMHKVYGIDYCFGNMKNKTNKIGFIINDNPNCILTTNILFHYNDYEKSVFCHKGVFSLNVTFNNMSNLCNAFRELQLDKLDISNLNTNNVNNMVSMFYHSNITKLYGYENKNFDENVDIRCFLRYGKIGNYINLSTWDIKVNNVEEAFFGSNFETIDLSNFDVSNVKSFFEMFYSINIKYLYIKNWDTSNVTNVAFDSFLDYPYAKEVYLNIDKNKILTNLLTDNSFSCSDNKCVRQSNNKLTNLINKKTKVKENNTSSYSNNGVNYFFELSGKIYNITSNLVNDYIVNPFQRLLRILR